MTDILSAVYVMMTLLFVFTQQKEIMRLVKTSGTVTYQHMSVESTRPLSVLEPLRKGSKKDETNPCKDS